MEILTFQRNHIYVVKASGRVDSFTSSRLAEAFHQLLEAQHFNLVFDMTDIDYISSAGLRVMIDVQKTCRQDNKGELVLVGVQKRIYETLELAGFVSLFRFFEDVETAISKF